MATIEDAKKEFKKKYNNKKVGKHISLCHELFIDYKDFCYLDLDREAVSTRIQLLLVKDMLENSKGK